MSLDEVKPEIEAGVQKTDMASIATNGSLPQEVGIIQTAPDDIKPPRIDTLFDDDSPPPVKSELPSLPSRSPSPGPSRPTLNSRNPSKRKPVVEHKPMLIDDLPTAWDEAHQSFAALDKCVYETKGLGLSREQDDMMVCDCMYDKREWRQLCLEPFGVVTEEGSARCARVRVGDVPRPNTTSFVSPWDAEIVGSRKRKAGELLSLV